MKFGLPISVLSHVIAGLGGAVLLSRPAPTLTDSVIVPVEVITIDELTNIKASIAAPTPRPSPEPMTSQTPMENASEVGDAQNRVVEPEDTPEPVPDDNGQEEIKSDPSPKPPEFNLDDMAALIDRTRDQQEEANQQIANLGIDNPDYSVRNQRGIGEGTALTANEAAALKSRMYQCWNMMAAAKDPESLTVRVHIKLRADGHVNSVKIVDGGSSNNPFLPVARSNAVNAVRDCAPYGFLPAEKYEAWRDMILTFKPDV